MGLLNKCGMGKTLKKGYNNNNGPFEYCEGGKKKSTSTKKSVTKKKTSTTKKSLSKKKSTTRK